MNTLIFRTAAPLIAIVMVMFAVFILLRGHNEPGGGFIGGLIAAAAMAVFGMAHGVEAVQKSMHFSQLSIAGFGVFIAGLAGLPSLLFAQPFLTGQWVFFHIGSSEVALSTPMVFDIGVFFAVFGTVSAVLLALERIGEAP